MLKGEKKKRWNVWPIGFAVFCFCVGYPWLTWSYDKEQGNQGSIVLTPSDVVEPITNVTEFTKKVDDNVVKRYIPTSEHEFQIFTHKSTKVPAKTDPTMALHLGVERLSKLLVTGTAWGGHVSAGVFIPCLRSDPEALVLLNKLTEFHRQVEESDKFRLDIGVVYGLKLDSDDTPAEMYRKEYPVNTLRNIALAQVQTDLVIIWNYDIQNSPKMVEATKEGDAWEDGLAQIRAGNGIAGVIPVFELAYGASAPVDKRDIVEQYKVRKIIRYYGDRERVHCGTDYGKWLNTEEPYFAAFHRTYEPFFIAKTDELPWFPDHLKGYLGDREMYIWYMAARKWKFLVLPTHFGIHPWHPNASGFKLLTENREFFQYAVKMNRDFKKHTLAMEGSIDPVEGFESLRPLYTSMPEVSTPHSENHGQEKTIFHKELDCNRL